MDANTASHLAPRWRMAYVRHMEIIPLTRTDGNELSEVRTSDRLSTRAHGSASGTPIWTTQAPASQADRTAVLRQKIRLRVDDRLSPLLDGVVDTGAAVSVIPEHMVREMGLKPVKKSTFKSYDGTPRECDCYDIEFLIADLSPRRVCVPAIVRTDVLVGRDILSRCRFTYDGLLSVFILTEPVAIMRFIWTVHYWLAKRWETLRERFMIGRSQGRHL